MIKWPKNPLTGDFYVNNRGSKWKYNGKAWVPVREAVPKILNLQFSHSPMDPVDSGFYLIGNLTDSPAQSNTSISSKRLPSAVTGRVTGVSIMTQIIGELGTDEDQSFILRNHTKSTQVIISNEYKNLEPNQLETYPIGEVFDVVKGDELEIIWQTPIFVIAPTAIRHGFSVNIEY